MHQSHTTLSPDVAATREILEQQVGKVVLVGHSSGGAVISIAGQRDKVKALAYVSALVPEVGENISQLISSMAAPSDSIQNTRDGQLFFDQSRFHADFAADLTVNRTNYMAVSQVPATSALVGATVWGAAWRDKPSYAIVSRDGRALSADLQRWMYKRAKATVTEIAASHVAHPRARSRKAGPLLRHQHLQGHQPVRHSQERLQGPQQLQGRRRAGPDQDRLPGSRRHPHRT